MWWHAQCNPTTEEAETGVSLGLTSQTGHFRASERLCLKTIKVASTKEALSEVAFWLPHVCTMCISPHIQEYTHKQQIKIKGKYTKGTNKISKSCSRQRASH